MTTDGQKDVQNGNRENVEETGEGQREDGETIIIEVTAGKTWMRKTKDREEWRCLSEAMFCLSYRSFCQGFLFKIYSKLDNARQQKMFALEDRV